MKKALLLLLFAASPVVASTSYDGVYACQFTKSAGMSYKDGAWQTSDFDTDAPFFLEVKNGKLDARAIHETFNIGTKLDLPICADDLIERVESCAGHFGQQMMINFESLNGGYSELTDAAADEDVQKSVSISLFTCQKM
ncbi:hypothetical protein [Paracoccus sp. SSK6]|uniref:hypothetical protein n=1 Tax=Paracoccus sp. SSK6 TaxID=3143131 RepID=UPI003218FF4B